MTAFSDFIFHMDDWLQQAILLHPLITFLLIFSFVFIESAFFPLAPFLPGEGLLFSIGVLAAGNFINLWIAIPVLLTGGILGTRAAFLKPFQRPITLSWLYFTHKNSLNKGVTAKETAN